MQQIRRAGPRRSSRKRAGRLDAIGLWVSGKGCLLATTAFFVVASLLGGGVVGSSISYFVLMVATIPFAVFCAGHDGVAALKSVPLTGRIALIGIALLPLLQLVPLPPTIWHDLPGGGLRRAVLSLVGAADQWQPLSLAPTETAACAVMAIGFVALTWMLLRLSQEDSRQIQFLAFAVVLVNIGIGLVQVISDGQILDFHGEASGATMLGFFANKNHLALVIACSIPLFGFVVASPVPSNRRPPAYGVAMRRRFAVIGYCAFALICIVATNSRAGLALGLLAAAVLMTDLAQGVALRYRLAAVAVVLMLALLVTSSSAFEVVFSRVDDVSSDLRWRISSWSWPLAGQYVWTGSGIGSFKTLFAAHEQLSWVKPTYVNAVHDDYLQLVIETGLPGVVLLVLLVLSLVADRGTLLALKGAGQNRRDMMFGLTATILFALHSAVDYPLRRPSAWTFFALALAAVYQSQQRARSPDRGFPSGSEAA